MTKRKWLVLLVAALPWVAGCKLEKGIGDGLSSGASTAFSSLIETPVNWWLDQQFGAK